jgi:hypothetical protein
LVQPLLDEQRSGNFAVALNDHKQLIFVTTIVLAQVSCSLHPSFVGWFMRPASFLMLLTSSGQGSTLSTLLGVWPVAQRIVPMYAPIICPASSGIRDRSAMALSCNTSSASTRGLFSLRNLQSWHRQGLALLHRNDSDQFLHTENGSTSSTSYNIESTRNVEDQATEEMGYLKPQEKHSCMVTKQGCNQRNQVRERKSCQHGNLLTEAKGAKEESQPLAAQGIIHLGETPNAQKWMGSRS